MACVQAADLLTKCVSTAQNAGPPKMQLFENDDACGDVVIALANGLQFQVANALSAICFIIAGAQLVLRASTPMARAYGFMMCLVGVGSCSFHATSSLMSFFIDIVPMAVTAALMLFRGMHALQLDSGCRGPSAETHRFLVAMGTAFVAVYVPWMMVVVGFSHPAVWGVWALLFGAMGAIFGVIALIVFANEGLLCTRCGRDLGVAILFILLGLGCTVHSFLPGLCSGWRTVFPLHALWHLCSAVTANRCGHVLDALSSLVARAEDAPQSKSKRAPLWLRMTQDLLPSQFSM